jgi:hypothetical protein
MKRLEIGHCSYVELIVKSGIFYLESPPFQLLFQRFDVCTSLFTFYPNGK